MDWKSIVEEVNEDGKGDFTGDELIVLQSCHVNILMPGYY